MTFWSLTATNDSVYQWDVIETQSRLCSKPRRIHFTQRHIKSGVTEQSRWNITARNITTSQTVCKTLTHTLHNLPTKTTSHSITKTQKLNLCTYQRLVVFQPVSFVDYQHVPVNWRQRCEIMADKLIRRQKNVKLWTMAVTHLTRLVRSSKCSLFVTELLLSVGKQ